MSNREIDLGSGVFALIDNETGKLRCELRELQTLRKLLGDDAMIAIVQLFNAVDRIDCFAHLLSLNATTPRTPAWERNHKTLVFLVLGTLYEVRSALTLLENAGVGTRVGETFSHWQHLQAIADRWKDEPMLGRIRNKLAHHLGDKSDIRKGLGALLDGEVLVMFDGSTGATHQHTSFPFAFDILLNGLGIDMKHFMSVVTSALNDANAIGQSAQAVLMELLRSHGLAFTSIAEVDAWWKSMGRS